MKSNFWIYVALGGSVLLAVLWLFGGFGENRLEPTVDPVVEVAPIQEPQLSTESVEGTTSPGASEEPQPPAALSASAIESVYQVIEDGEVIRQFVESQLSDGELKDLRDIITDPLQLKLDVEALLSQQGLPENHRALLIASLHDAEVSDEEKARIYLKELEATGRTEHERLVTLGFYLELPFSDDQKKSALKEHIKDKEFLEQAMQRFQHP